ncbi:MAG: cytochrome c [Chloroflexi bacterium]|nr:MAG: cytochrome c [Chloroflexota bacterium]
MMQKRFLLVFFALAGLLLLVACGGGGNESGEAATEEAVGDPVRGEQLYKQTTIGSASAPGCITCHSLEEGVQLVGPSHAGVATRAETAVPGMSAEEFLRESIIDPDAHVAEGFTPGIMYPNYGNELSEQDINDLVAFLLTLK